jgi:hypothetical protein
VDGFVGKAQRLVDAHEYADGGLGDVVVEVGDAAFVLAAVVVGAILILVAFGGIELDEVVPATAAELAAQQGVSGGAR